MGVSIDNVHSIVDLELGLIGLHYSLVSPRIALRKPSMNQSVVSMSTVPCAARRLPFRTVPSRTIRGPQIRQPNRQIIPRTAAGDGGSVHMQGLRVRSSPMRNARCRTPMHIHLVSSSCTGSHLKSAGGYTKRRGRRASKTCPAALNAQCARVVERQTVAATPETPAAAHSVSNHAAGVCGAKAQIRHVQRP